MLPVRSGSLGTPQAAPEVTVIWCGAIGVTGVFSSMGLAGSGHWSWCSPGVGGLLMPGRFPDRNGLLTVAATSSRRLCHDRGHPACGRPAKRGRLISGPDYVRSRRCCRLTRSGVRLTASPGAVGCRIGLALCVSPSCLRSISPECMCLVQLILLRLLSVDIDSTIKTGCDCPT